MMASRQKPTIRKTEISFRLEDPDQVHRTAVEALIETQGKSFDREYIKKYGNQIEASYSESVQIIASHGDIPVGHLLFVEPGGDYHENQAALYRQILQWRKNLLSDLSNIGDVVNAARFHFAIDAISNHFQAYHCSDELDPRTEVITTQTAVQPDYRRLGLATTMREILHDYIQDSDRLEGVFSHTRGRAKGMRIRLSPMGKLLEHLEYSKLIRYGEVIPGSEFPDYVMWQFKM
tara:strand:- start:46 stop:747 length:702 start_codon:yes stop_codon:yes gene_type:complete